MEKQNGISASKLQKRIGQIMTVLVDDMDGDVAIARSSADAPEIDGVVFVEGGAELVLGEFAEVRITDAEEYDLVAEMAPAPG